MIRPVVMLLLLLLIAPASALITAEVGETYIRWEWSATAYGNETLVNATSGAPADSLRVKTLTPLSTILFFLGIELILALLCVLLQDPARTILTGALGGVLGFYLFGLTLGHGALWLVVLALVGFQALFVVLALYNLLEDALRWW